MRTSMRAAAVEQGLPEHDLRLDRSPEHAAAASTTPCSSISVRFSTACQGRGAWSP